MQKGAKALCPAVLRVAGLIATKRPVYLVVLQQVVPRDPARFPGCLLVASLVEDALDLGQVLDHCGYMVVVLWNGGCVIVVLTYYLHTNYNTSAQDNYSMR